MPEGDTLFRIARTLGTVLVGETIDGVHSGNGASAQSLRPLLGQRIEKVESLGKNLLIHAGTLALHTHLRMHGTWHLYAPGEGWRRPSRDASVALSTPRAVAACFDAPVVRLLRRSAIARDRSLAIGPDLLSPTYDRALAVRQVLSLHPMEVGEAIMTQRAVAGIGNIYKSETLFAECTDPFAPVGELGEEGVAAVLDRARVLMLHNVATKLDLRSGEADTSAHFTHTMRTTAMILGRGQMARDARFCVYRRNDEPCFRCGTAIRRALQGDAARSTYHCPQCQKSRK